MLGVLVALGHALGQLDLLLRREQRHLADLLEVHAHRVVGGVAVGQLLGGVDLLLGDLLDVGEVVHLGDKIVQRRQHVAGGHVDVDAVLLERLIELVDGLAVEVHVLETFELLRRELAGLLALFEQLVEPLLGRLFGRVGGVFLFLRALSAGLFGQLGLFGQVAPQQGVRHFLQLLFGVIAFVFHILSLVYVFSSSFFLC